MIIELVLEKLKDTNGKIIQILSVYSKDGKELLETAHIV